MNGKLEWTRRQLLATGGAAAGLGMLATAAPVAAQDDAADAIVGSWTGTVTLTRPALPAPVPRVLAFTSLLSFMPGGVFCESHRYYNPPLLGTTGHGVWKQTAPHTYEVFTRFIAQAAPPSTGTVLGTDNIRMFLTHEPVSQTLNGWFESELRDTQDKVLQAFAGTTSAVRITV